MISKENFARVVWWWYWKQLQRSLYSVGHLIYAGFILPKSKVYEYQHPFKRSRNQAFGILQ